MVEERATERRAKSCYGTELKKTERYIFLRVIDSYPFLYGRNSTLYTFCPYISLKKIKKRKVLTCRFSSVVVLTCRLFQVSPFSCWLLVSLLQRPYLLRLSMEALVFRLHYYTTFKTIFTHLFN